MEQLKDRIRYVRNLRKLSQKQVADKVQTSQSTINDLESGRIKKSTYLVRIADALDVDMRWLIEGVGSPAAEGISIVNQGSPLPMYLWPDLYNILVDRDDSVGMVDLVYKCPVQHSPQSYCLAISSVQATHQFNAGEIIFVDPVTRYTDGCFVIAIINNHCVLRQLVTDGIESYLKTDNASISEDRRMIPVNLDAIKDGVIEVPAHSERGVKATLAGRVILREEILL